MTALVLFASPGAPSLAVQAAYRGAVAPAALRWIPIPGFSQVFVEEARRCTVDGRCLPGLLARWAPDVPDPSAVAFVGFSAGCWLGRDGLYRSPVDRAALAASVMLDGAHTPYRANTKGAPEEASEAELRRFLLASLVHEMAVVHSDTRTPPPGDPKGYASTTVVARALQAAGSPAAIIHRPGGHGAVLNEHGPEVLRTWLAPILAAHRLEDAPAPTWHDGLDLGAMTLGERGCSWLGYQFGLAPREIPGAQHNPLIVAYSQGCRRGGTFLGVDEAGAPLWRGGTPIPLGTDEEAWCAALQAARLIATWRAGDPIPYMPRVAVREYVEDSKAAGTWRDLYWRPTAPGALAVFARWVVRGGQRVLADPTRGDNGHIVGVTAWDGEGFGAIGGNEGDTIGHSWHRFNDPLLCGWIEV